MPWYVEWGKLLTYRQTWSFAFGKFMTDGVWWFFLFWLPAYLKAQYAMTGTQIAVPVAVLYTMTCVGSISGGWFPMFFINRGYEPYAGRMRAMFVIALFLSRCCWPSPWGATDIGCQSCSSASAPRRTRPGQPICLPRFRTCSRSGPWRPSRHWWDVWRPGRHLGQQILAVGFSMPTGKPALPKTWLEAKTGTLGAYLDQIRSLHLLNKHGSVIDLDKVELGSLPKEVVIQLQATNAIAFAQLKQLQTRLVLSEMVTSYAIMFGVCALAYVCAWSVMKMLVPRFKKIENL